MATQPKAIPLSTLSPRDLAGLHRTLQSELMQLQENFEQLLSVQQIYLSNKDIINALSTSQVQGKQMLVPMNSSLYMKGDIDTYDRVIIDVGANYFISKKLPAALDFYDRKIKLVETQKEKILKIMAERIEMITSVQEQMAKTLQASQPH